MTRTREYWLVHMTFTLPYFLSMSNIWTTSIPDENSIFLTIDQNGFYHTGDVGYMDKDGFLTITGRIKELLITRGGENIAPVLIENNIKKELGDVISDVVVIGDNEKFLTCLITLRVNIVDEMPTQEIDDLVQFNLFKNEGIDVKMIEDAINNKRFNKYIEDGIKKANKKTVSNAQTVKKFAILQNNFTVPGGELTPTLKKKRPIINRKNQSVIDELYGR